MGSSRHDIRAKLWKAIDQSPFNPLNSFTALFGALPEPLPGVKSPIPPQSGVSRPLISAPLPPIPVIQSVNRPFVLPGSPAPPKFIFAPDTERKTEISREFLPHPIDVFAGPSLIAWVTEVPTPRFEFDLDGQIVFMPSETEK
jgi:hypothetical protein